MRSRLLRRRVATAAGLYASVVLGIVAMALAAQILGLQKFGVFATALAAASFLQMLLDVTVEDALTKVGFRYVAAEEWGRLRRLFVVAIRLKLVGGAAATLLLAAFAPFAERVFGEPDLFLPVLLAAALPLVQCTETVSTTALLLRGRYDLRGAYVTFTQTARLVAILAAAPHGVAWAVAGVVVAQAVATGLVWIPGRLALARFPVGRMQPLGDDAPGIRTFVVRSSIASGLVAARTSLAPLVLGVVAGTTATGLFRIALAPQTGFYAASSPVRLILLTEQTRDWERGERERVFAGIRRYTQVALAVSLVTVPTFFVLMPWLVRVVYGEEFTAATSAARIVLFAAAVQLVVGWSKSFATTIGRPELRIVAYGIETAVLIPLTAVLGAAWGVEGAAVAVLVSSIALALTWSVILRRLHERRSAMGPVDEGAAA